MARGIRADRVEEFAAKRQEALRLAWAGLQSTAIARKDGRDAVHDMQNFEGGNQG